ncbi:OmpA family protein [Oxalobacteraceae bacterium]|nr:OmpA family protein [Oxalobacteraceae bacterium]
MRQLIHRVLLLVILVIMVGCSTCPSVLSDAGAKIEVSGLNISIPKTTPIPIQLGKFIYEPQEVKNISDTILAINEYKNAQCVLMVQLSDLRPQPVADITKIATDISSSNKLILGIATALASGPSKQTVLQTVADSIKQSTAPTTPPPRVEPAPVAFLPPKEWYLDTDNRLRKMLALLGDSIGEHCNYPRAASCEERHISQSVNNLTISLHGFASGKSKLTNIMKEEVATFFRKVSESVSTGELLTIALVGYADPSGMYTKNITLGLSRARSVADYIAQIDLKKPSRMHLISSGGISNDFSDGRQVEIYVFSSTI